MKTGDSDQLSFYAAAGIKDIWFVQYAAHNWPFAGINSFSRHGGQEPHKQKQAWSRLLWSSPCFCGTRVFGEYVTVTMIVKASVTEKKALSALSHLNHGFEEAVGSTQYCEQDFLLNTYIFNIYLPIQHLSTPSKWLAGSNMLEAVFCPMPLSLIVLVVGDTIFWNWQDGTLTLSNAQHQNLGSKPGQIQVQKLLNGMDS